MATFKLYLVFNLAKKKSKVNICRTGRNWDGK